MKPFAHDRPTARRSRLTASARRRTTPPGANARLRADAGACQITGAWAPSPIACCALTVGQLYRPDLPARRATSTRQRNRDVKSVTEGSRGRYDAVVLAASTVVTAPAVPSLDRLLRVRVQHYLGWSGIIAVATLVTRVPLVSRYLFSWDSANFALALDQYNVAAHQPHPPGYPLYVAVAWMLRPLFVDANATYVGLSIAASACSAVLLLGLSWRLMGQRAALVAVLLLVTSPNAWGHGLVAYPYAFLSLFSAAVAWASIETRWGSHNLSLAGALLLGIGSGFRPDLLLLIGPLWVFGVWQRGLRTIGIGLLVVAASVAAWFIPMLAHSGGWPGYLAASEIYADYWATPHGSVGQFVLGMRTNFDELTGYLTQSTGPMFALLLVYAIGRVLAPPVLRVRPRLGILFVWTVPALAFYSIVHIGNLGYLLSILPALCILGAASIEAAASDVAGMLGHRVSARWLAVGLGTVAASVSSRMFLGVAGPVTLHEIRDVDREFTGALPMVRPYPVAPTLVLAFDRYRQYDYYLPRYRRADHLVAAIDLRQDRLGRATFQVPAGISTIVLPDLYANSAETPGRVERVTGTDGAVVFVAHVQPGDQLRIGPGYARTVAH